MGNSESSSQFPPPSNNDDGNNKKIPNWDQRKKTTQEEEEGTITSALKIGAVVAGSALFALGAYALASSSSTDSGEGDSVRKRVAQMQDLKHEGFGGGSGGGGGAYNHDLGMNQGFASQTIKIMSYNVWIHEDVKVDERMEAIRQLISEESPDIILFQEVTPNIYNLFKKSSLWTVYPYCSVPPEKAAGRSNFCMLLSKLAVERYFCEPVGNSNMGKEICGAEIDVGMHDNLVVATSHLKCRPPPEMNSKMRGMNSKERVAQAKKALKLLDSDPNVIFGGDVNWDESTDGPFPPLVGWQDPWSILRPGEDGWTYDTKLNAMLKGRRPLQKRLDRFACKLKDFKMVSVDRIGMDAIPGISYPGCTGREELPVYPSDHYGLVLTIRPIQYRMH